MVKFTKKIKIYKVNSIHYICEPCLIINCKICSNIDDCDLCFIDEYYDKDLKVCLKQCPL